MQTSLAIADYPPADRLEVWRQATARSFVPIDVFAGEGGLRVGRLTYHDVGRLRIYDVRADAGEVIRGTQRIAETTGEFLLVSMQRRGACVVTQDDRQARLQPGELVCYDTTRPFRVGFPGPFHAVYARIPRHLLGISSHVFTRLTARAIPTSAGPGRILGSLLTDLLADAANYAGPGEEDLGHALINLTRAAVVAYTPDDQAIVSAGSRMRERILRFIDENLTEPDLSPRRVAQAHAISTRYLHQVFAEAGTTYGHSVRERRLRLAARELRAPHTRNRTIESIARRCGFNDAAHFSHIFRATYGVTPRQWRQSD